MIYKITGQTGRGRCACGHTAKASEEYYIFTTKRKFNSLCKKCAKGMKSYNTVRIPEDLDNGIIRLR